MEEMQEPLDLKALETEKSKLNTNFAKWADKLQDLYGKEAIPTEPNPYDDGVDGKPLWKTHSPQEFKSKFHTNKDVQEAKKTDCFSRKTFDGKSKCIQNKKGFEKEDADAYVASVLRKKGEIKEDYSKQQKENKTMKISKADLMEIIKEEIMGAMSEQEAVEEAAEEQPLEEMDVASMLSPENIEALRIAYEALQKLVTNGVIPMAALGAGAGALYNKVAGPQVPPEDMGDK